MLTQFCGQARLRACCDPRTRPASQPSRASRLEQSLRATSATIPFFTVVPQVHSTYLPTPGQHSARPELWAARPRWSTSRRTRPSPEPYTSLLTLESSSPPITALLLPRYRPPSPRLRRSLSASAPARPGTSTPSATARQGTSCTHQPTTARHGPTSRAPRASAPSAAASSQAARTRPGRSTWAPTDVVSSTPQGR